MSAMKMEQSMLHKTILGVLGFALLMTLSHACPNTVQCACEDTEDGKNVVNCRDKGLTRVPSFTNDPFPYYELTLALNKITILEDMAFSGLNIQRLDLSENMIFSISNNAFSGLEDSLEELVLHVDQMNDMPILALRELKKLKSIELKGFNTPTLPARLFETHTQLSKIVLSANRITSLQPSVFENIQASITHLDISSNVLNTLPVDVLQSLQNLKIFKVNHNEITTIPSDAFSSNSLTELDMSLLGIITIRENAFRGLEQSLNTLDLSRNRLTDFQLQPLKSLRQLQNLNLANNEIMTLPTTVFQSIQNLKTLDMSHNNIGSVARETMQNLARSLETLHLGKNSISSIEAGSFDNFNLLKDLDLNVQNLEIVLIENIFFALQNLENLNLNDTNFSNNNWPALNGLSNLVTLTLSHNAISSIPEFAFLYSIRLHTLNLAENSLSALTQKSVYGLQKTLKKIDLSGNNLETISHCVFDDFDFRNDLNFLNLDKNPINCDCQAKWMRQWIDDNTDSFTKFIIQWTCQSPASLQGRKIYDVRQDEMVCSPGFVEPPCEDLTPTSTTTSTTTQKYQPMLLNVTKISDRSVTIAIIVSHSDMTGYTVEYFIQGSDILAGSFDLDKDVRSFDIPGLKAATQYLTCVIMYLPNSQQERSCTDFETKETSAPVTPGSTTQTLAIALGATFGVLAFIIILVVVICCCCRKCRKDDDFKDGGGGIPTRSDMPHMGYNSKRFSKPKSTSSIMDEKELERKLQFFAPEERDRIWNVLTNTGGSTMSIISNGSSQRYVPDIQMSHYNPNRPPQLPDRPVGFGGYLNPQEVQDEDHHYYEIPEEFKQNAAMANPDPYADTAGRGASVDPPGSSYI